MAHPVRWGIVGCGRISHDFVSAMASLPSASLHACAARSLANAQAFAATHKIPFAHGSYEQLCADAAVDVVYVGTQHVTHFDAAMLALSYGKHVVVEKPMMMNASQVQQCVALAREKKCLLVEAVWTRFFPALAFVRTLLQEKRIGEVRNVHAHMGVAFPTSVASVWSRAMGGGGLNCIGIYPLTFATLALGTEPVKVTATGGLTPDGVDAYSTVTLEYSGQRFATVEYTLLANMGAAVTLVGTLGRIEIHDPAYAPTKVSLTLVKEPRIVETSVFPLPPRAADAVYNFSTSEGLVYEAAAITNAIQNQQTEMDEYPLDEAIGVATLMQEIRRQVGVKYDSDEPSA
jgi:dihydrodiol dehydrogenase / D-xylose 1-dehydrogenase (NADP)